MELTVRIPAVKFNRSAWGRDYHVEVELTVDRRSLRLSDSSQTFHPNSYDDIPTQGEAWSRHFDDVHLRSHLSLTVRFREVTSTSPLAEINYHWVPADDIGMVRLNEGACTIVVVQELPRHDGRTPVYVRRGSGNTTLVTRRPLAYAEIDPCVPRPGSRDRPRRHSYPYFVHTARIQPLAPVTEPTINPAVIPSTSGEPSPAWRRQWLARFQLQFLAHTGDDASVPTRLDWRFESIAGGASAELMGPPHGTFVTFVGRGEGEGRVVVSYNGTTLSAVRVLVRPPARIATRVVVLLPPAPEPRRAALQAFNLGKVNEMIRNANRYLRQVAVRLDEVESVTPLEVERGDTMGVSFEAAKGLARRLGHGADLTIGIVESFADLIHGITPGIPVNRISNDDREEDEDGLVSFRFLDHGSPSTSWIWPDGVPPLEERTDPVSMRFIQRGTSTHAFVCLALLDEETTGLNGKTLAHETGHALNLAHRQAPAPPHSNVFDQMADIFTPNDNVRDYTHRANLMCVGGGDGDLDVAQAKVLWRSPLLRRL